MTAHVHPRKLEQAARSGDPGGAGAKPKSNHSIARARDTATPLEDQQFPKVRDVSVCLDELNDVRQQRDDAMLSLREQGEICFAIEQLTREIVALR